MRWPLARAWGWTVGPGMWFAAGGGGGREGMFVVLGCAAGAEVEGDGRDGYWRVAFAAALAAREAGLEAEDPIVVVCVCDQSITGGWYVVLGELNVRREMHGKVSEVEHLELINHDGRDAKTWGCSGPCFLMLAEPHFRSLPSTAMS